METARTALALLILLGGVALFMLAGYLRGSTKSWSKVGNVLVIASIVFLAGLLVVGITFHDIGYAAARDEFPRDKGETALKENEVYWKVASVQLQAGEWIAIIQTRDGEKMYYSFQSDVPAIFIRKMGADGQPLYEPIATKAVSGERNPEEPAVPPKTP